MTKHARLVRLWAVILAGEAVFLLPFVLPRLMRPTMLRQWEISNTELGTAFSVYGFVAMVAYWFGGPLADRFQPRKLMALALAVTAAAGVVMTQSPSAIMLAVLYGFFGCSTILLFWSAMLRTTHDLASDSTQGAAFGILDAGRGLVAALIASSLVVLIGKEASIEKAAWIACGFVAVTSVLIYFGLPDAEKPAQRRGASWAALLESAKDGRLWRQGLIVVCAYCGFKGIDTYGLFLVDAFSADEATSTRITALVFWVRPVAAIAAGVLADRAGRFITLTTCFVAMAGLYLAMALSPWLAGSSAAGVPVVVVIILLGAASFVYALRGVYFAVSKDLDIPEHRVGTAMGLISMIGFLPDVFFGPFSGMILDRNPGAAGHQIVFASVAAMAVAGAVLSVRNGKAVRPDPSNQTDQSNLRSVGSD